MKRLAAGVLASGLLAACSGVRPYPEVSPGNLVVRTELSGARAALHVRRVNADCSGEYEGTVALDRSPVSVGLPAGRPSYLVFSFDTSSFFSGSRSTSVGTLIEPRAGYRYDATVTYRDGLYNVTLRETDLRRRTSRELPLRTNSRCGR
jgi:hypothetical protein